MRLSAILLSSLLSSFCALATAPFFCFGSAHLPSSNSRPQGPSVAPEGELTNAPAAEGKDQKSGGHVSSFLSNGFCSYCILKLNSASQLLVPLSTSADVDRTRSLDSFRRQYHPHLIRDDEVVVHQVLQHFLDCLNDWNCQPVLPVGQPDRLLSLRARLTDALCLCYWRQYPMPPICRSDYERWRNGLTATYSVRSSRAP